MTEASADRSGVRPERAAVRVGAVVVTALTFLDLSVGAGNGGSLRQMEPRATSTVPMRPAMVRTPGRDSSRTPAGATKIHSPGRSWFDVESGPVTFGELVPGQPVEREAAIRVRVHSPRPWSLELVLDVPLQIVDRGGLAVPQSRMAWRTRQTGNYTGFAGGRSVPIARGGATGPFGEEVIVDLRMLLGDNDELGHYTTAFNLVLEGL